MRLHFTERFFDDYESLPERLQNRTDRALGFLLENFHHPSLRAHKLEGQRDPEGRDIWAASVTDAYRFTFAIDKDTETYLLYRLKSTFWTEGTARRLILRKGLIWQRSR